jgi:hypothetical protein
MTTQISGDTGVSAVQDGVVQQSDLAPNALAGLFATGTLFGLGGARALGTNYTNNSGRPMFVNVTVDVVSPASISSDVNGITVLGNNGGAGAFTNVSFIVPAGGTYTVNTSAAAGGIFFWTEFV